MTTREIPPEVAYLRVSLFQGEVGIDFANELDKLFADTLSRTKALIADLRANPRGGIGDSP